MLSLGEQKLSHSWVSAHSRTWTMCMWGNGYSQPSCCWCKNIAPNEFAFVQVQICTTKCTVQAFNCCASCQCPYKSNKFIDFTFVVLIFSVIHVSILHVHVCISPCVSLLTSCLMKLCAPALSPVLHTTATDEGASADGQPSIRLGRRCAGRQGRTHGSDATDARRESTHVHIYPRISH